MKRNSLLSLWQSRSRLAILSATFAVLISLLNIFRASIEGGVQKIVRKNNTFGNDIDYVMETFQYMRDLKTGNAEIRPVVEKSKGFKEYWLCRYDQAKFVVNNGWIRNEDLYIYSATFDDRWNSLYPSNNVIQVLAMSYRSIPKDTKYFCNINDLRNQKYTVVEGTVREIWQRAWDPRDLFYIPNLISCPVPSRFKFSSNLTVSLTSVPCTSTDFAVMVRRGKTPKEGRRGVAVCVKGMDFLKDVSTRLVEWIEAQYLMGADTITMYTYYVSPETERVLEYYKNLGKLNVIPIDLPGESPNQSYIRSQFIWRNRQQKRRHELIPYNDCLYRHIHSHEYILIVDTDELVVPLKADNWTEMLKETVGSPERWKQDVTSISIRNSFKFPSSQLDENAPKFMYMLRNRRRSQQISKAGDYGKSFTSTKSVATVFNHFGLHRLHANVTRTIYVKEDVALKLHYKEKCPIESKNECPTLEKITVDDTSLDRFAKQLTRMVTNALNKINST